MPVMFQSWPVVIHLMLIVLMLISEIIPFSSCQLGSPRNVETFYPFETPAPAPAPNFSNPPLTPSSSPQPTLPQLAPPPQSKSSSSSSKGTIVKAVAATAASTLVLAALFFYFLQKGVISRRRRDRVGDSPQTQQGGLPVMVSSDDFKRFDGNLQGLIVDENGLDVIYWRRLQEGSDRNSFRKKIITTARDEEEEEKGMNYKGNRSRKKPEPIQEIPLLRGKSSTSHSQLHQEDDNYNLNGTKTPPNQSVGVTLKAIEKPGPIQPSNPPPPPPPPPPILRPQPPPPPMAIQSNKSPATPPPPPPIPVKKSPAPPPPPPRARAAVSKPPPVPKGTSSREPSRREAATGTENGQVKLKPLHWDKMNTNADHSMVWDKIDGGSFRFDGDLMEALFGSVATNKKSPPRNSNSKNPINPNTSSSAQIFILDPRKSQNTAIVLKSLTMSREKILEEIIEGHDIDVDTLEKLTRIGPTKEEEALLLEFDGDQTRLADAESFLFHLLKAIPSAFTCLNAMLFRSNYDSEILHLKETLQTLDLGCKELRTQGLFMKLLEAILKAGNRMNAGTSRGNAQAFNLTALQKLSDVKSIDGKTTLLHFVVEEVVRSEGKRCIINRNRSLNRSSSRNSNSSSSLSSENSISREEREKEYVMLGLPMVGGLSTKFSNVKKAATIDYYTLVATCSALAARAAEIRQIMLQFRPDREGSFVKKMKGFLESAEEELKVVREEQTRVMELVKKTTDFYQAGASKNQGAHPLQLFVIIKDFLSMVDQECVEIARNLQKRKTTTSGFGSSTPNSSVSRSPVRFPILPENFMSDKSRSSSSESDSGS